MEVLADVGAGTGLQLLQPSLRLQTDGVSDIACQTFRRMYLHSYAAWSVAGDKHERQQENTDSTAKVGKCWRFFTCKIDKVNRRQKTAELEQGSPGTIRKLVTRPLKYYTPFVFVQGARANCLF